MKRLLLLVALLSLVVAALCDLGTLCVTPHRLAFSDPEGNGHTRTLQIHNSGAAPVTISSLELVDNDGAFEIVEGLPSSPLELEADATAEVSVRFEAAGDEEAEHEAALRVNVDGQVYAFIDVALNGLALSSEPDPETLIKLLGLSNVESQVAGQRFQRARRALPVHLAPLAAFGESGSVRYGWYPVDDVSGTNQLGQLSSGDAGFLSASAKAFDPEQTVFGIYASWAALNDRTVHSEDDANTFSGIADGKQVRTWRLADRAHTYILAFEADDDTAGYRDALFLLSNVEPVADIILMNQDGAWADADGAQPGFYEDHLVFHRINGGTTGSTANPPFADPNFQFLVHNVSAIVVKNARRDQQLSIASVAFSSANFHLMNDPQFPMAIPAGGSQELFIAYTQASGARGDYHATMTIEFGSGESKAVSLGALYMGFTENTNEVRLHQINNAFGYSVDTFEQEEILSEIITSPIVGEAVRSGLWLRADPAAGPAHAREIAAFLFVDRTNPVCVKHNFKAGAQESAFNVAPPYGQTIMPKACEGGPSEWSEASADWDMPFEFVVSYDWSSNSQDAIDVHWWPLRDRRGFLWPNTYLAAADFILPSGCGPNPGQANCDYNDNVFVISNVRPSATRYGYLAAVPPVGDSALLLEFEQPVAGTLGDSADRGTGFVFTLTHKDEHQHLSSVSYDKSKLALADGRLAVTASRGGNADNSLVNGLTVLFNPGLGAFAVSGRLANPDVLAANGQQAGVMFGSDQNNILELVVYSTGSARRVRFASRVVVDQASPSYNTIAEEDLGDASGPVELVLVAHPSDNTVTAAFSTGGAAFAEVGRVNIGEDFEESRIGRFFGLHALGGIVVSDTLANSGFVAQWERFAVFPGDPLTGDAEAFTCSAVFRPGDGEDGEDGGDGGDGGGDGGDGSSDGGDPTDDDGSGAALKPFAFLF